MANHKIDMKRMQPFTRSATALLAGFGLTLVVLTARADNAAAPQSASAAGNWQKHEYSFAFLGFTSTYSCDGLADKLKILLIASGARPDVKAQSGACAFGYGQPDNFARANLTFYTLSPGAATADPSTPPVDGIWRAVTLARRSPRTLELGDCELVEQFKSNVLPMFDTRNVTSRTTCIPHQESGSVVDLQFEAFTATPTKSPT